MVNSEYELRVCCHGGAERQNVTRAISGLYVLCGPAKAIKKKIRKKKTDNR